MEMDREVAISYTTPLAVAEPLMPRANWARTPATCCSRTFLHVRDIRPGTVTPSDRA